jgi:transposase
MQEVRGTKREREARRMLAANLFMECRKTSEIASILGVTSGAVSQWRGVWNESGKEGLRSKAHPGRIPELDDEDRCKLAKYLADGPKSHGFDSELWTLPRVAKVIEDKFGVIHHSSHVSRILRQMNWSPQKPERQAKEQDETAVEKWREETWPEIKKAPRLKVNP